MENHQSSLSWFVWVNGCQEKLKNLPLLLKRSSRCRKINSSFYSTNIFEGIHKMNYPDMDRKWGDENEMLF